MYLALPVMAEARSPQLGDCVYQTACGGSVWALKPPSLTFTTTFYTSRMLPVKRSPPKTRFSHCDGP
ncbi:MAG: hypothetical protein EBE86_035430 [Hormoscilla sp. GUM202]|nr:hypothetical protein [Hormoscilla sp. GUM202]